MDVAVVAQGACWAVAAAGFGLYAWGTKKREKQAVREALIIDHFRASDDRTAEATKRPTRTRSANKDTLRPQRAKSESGDEFHRDFGAFIVSLARSKPGMTRPFYIDQLQHLKPAYMTAPSFAWQTTYVLSKLIADGHLVRKGIRYFAVGA